MVWAIVAAAAVSAGTAIYEGTQQAGIANSELSIAGNQEAKQNQSFQQLEALINNPNSFFQNNSVYSAAFNQGTQAIATQSAASGLNNTSKAVPQGGEAQALQAYGQSFGASQLFNQEQLLAGMSGTGYNPAGAAGAASGATSAAGGSLNSLAGLLSFFGTSNMLGGSGGSSTYSSAAVGAQSNIVGSESLDYFSGI